MELLAWNFDNLQSKFKNMKMWRFFFVSGWKYDDFVHDWLVIDNIRPYPRLVTHSRKKNLRIFIFLNLDCRLSIFQSRSFIYKRNEGQTRRLSRFNFISVGAGTYGYESYWILSRISWNNTLLIRQLFAAWADQDEDMQHRGLLD